MRFGTDHHRFIFAAKHMIRRAVASFQRSIDTLRRMSLKESTEVKPLHIEVIKVGPNDTVTTSAHRMGLPGNRTERFHPNRVSEIAVVAVWRWRRRGEFLTTVWSKL